MAFTGTATKNLGLPQWNPQDHPSFLTDINDAWNKIDENAGQVASEMEGVPEQLEQLQALTQSLNEDVSQNTAGLQNLEVRVGNVEAETVKVPGMQEQIAAAEGNIAENSRDIAAAQRDIASAETSIAANTTKITEAENAVAQANSDITANSNAIQTNRNNITKNRNDITEIKSENGNYRMSMVWTGNVVAISNSGKDIRITTVRRDGRVLTVVADIGSDAVPSRAEQVEFLVDRADTQSIFNTLGIHENVGTIGISSTYLFNSDREQNAICGFAIQNGVLSVNINKYKDGNYAVRYGSMVSILTDFWGIGA